MRTKGIIRNKIAGSLLFLSSLLPFAEGCQKSKLPDIMNTPPACSSFKPMAVESCVHLDLSWEARDGVVGHYLFHINGASIIDNEIVGSISVFDLDKACAFVKSFDISSATKYQMLILEDLFLGITGGFGANTQGDFERASADLYIQKLPLRSSLACGQTLFEGHASGKDKIKINIEDERILYFLGASRFNLFGYDYDAAWFDLIPGAECGTPVVHIVPGENEPMEINRYDTYWFSILIRNLKIVEKRSDGEADVKIWRDCSPRDGGIFDGGATD